LLFRKPLFYICKSANPFGNQYCQEKDASDHLRATARGYAIGSRACSITSTWLENLIACEEGRTAAGRFASVNNADPDLAVEGSLAAEESFKSSEEVDQYIHNDRENSINLDREEELLHDSNDGDFERPEPHSQDDIID
jgi:hypothetical protein